MNTHRIAALVRFTIIKINRMGTLLAFVLLLTCLTVRAQSTDEEQIRAALDTQKAAWSDGDLDGFMHTYEDSPETTFVGTSVHKGYTKIFENFRKKYSTAEQMGILTFTDLETHVLPSTCGKPEFALVLGRYHLDRTARGRGEER